MERAGKRDEVVGSVLALLKKNASCFCEVYDERTISEASDSTSETNPDSTWRRYAQSVAADYRSPAIQGSISVHIVLLVRAVLGVLGFICSCGPLPVSMF